MSTNVYIGPIITSKLVRDRLTCSCGYRHRPIENGAARFYFHGYKCKHCGSYKKYNHTKPYLINHCDYVILQSSVVNALRTASKNFKDNRYYHEALCLIGQYTVSVALLKCNQNLFYAYLGEAKDTTIDKVISTEYKARGTIVGLKISDYVDAYRKVQQIERE